MKTKQRMPILFAGHGSPMNAIEDNRWSRGYAGLGEQVPRPAAILAISAHWYVHGSHLTGDEHPSTIHDFGGFPQALFEVEYPAPGDPQLASQVRDLFADHHAAISNDWGLDHGSWSILCRMYPQADIPVVQLSMDRSLSVAQHFRLGQLLSPLRDEGVLIFASGNLTHNLRDAFSQMHRGSSITPEWASRFDESVRKAVLQHDVATLMQIHASEDGRLAHPTAEHWLPLIYALAAANENDPVRFPIEGFDWGSLSMRSIIWG